MIRNNRNRREFIKGLGVTSIGAGVFGLVTGSRSWAASDSVSEYRRSMRSLGTSVNITVFGEKEALARESVRAAFAEVRRMNDLMSTHQWFSEVSMINRLSGNETVTVDPAVAEVVGSAVEWSRRTEGVFDISTWPLLTAWGFREEAKNVPASVEAARDLVGWRGISVKGNEVGLEKRGAGIDVGGIAKGYAVDRAVGVLRRWGVTRAIVEAGGDLYAMGRPADADGWTIGLADPRTGYPCATFELADLAVATSGNHATRRVSNGRTHGDMFDPFTGEPVETWLSLSASARTAADADAASTALFVAGRSTPEWSKRLSEVGALTIDGTAGDLRFTAGGAFPDYERV